MGKNRLKTAADHFNGKLFAPAVGPADGYIRSLEFLDANGYLRSGDSLTDALHRCGISLTDQVGRAFEVRPVGFFQDGVVSEEGREFLEILCDEGFNGSVSYLLNSDHQEITINDGRFMSSADYLVRACG